MYSIIGVLKKPDYWTTEQFRDWWVNDHAEIAKQLPGLRRYTIHPLTHNLDGFTGELGGAPSHDGVAFLWFDDEDAARNAFASSSVLTALSSMSKSSRSLVIRSDIDSAC